MKKWIKMLYFGMERDFYSKLDQWAASDKRKPLILRGARQVGKTYGVLQWAQKKYSKVVYLNFEKDRKLHLIFEETLSPQKLIAKIENYSSLKIDPEQDLIFFDEIQLCGTALNSLKYFNEDLPNMAVLAAGSLLGLVLNSEPFPVGKVQFLEIYPLSFREFLKAQGKDHYLDEVLSGQGEYLHDQLIEKLKHYLIIGGAPEVIAHYVTLRNPKSHSDFLPLRKKQEDLINSYMADMAKHCGKINSMNLERFWRNIPEQLARRKEKTSRFVFKDVLPSKNKYSQMSDVIDWLDTAGLIYRIQIANQGLSPLTAFTKESFFKLYLFDTGILNALSGLSPAEIINYDFGTFKGYLLENFVLQSLIALYGKKLYSWSEGTADVDFIREINGINVPIEVKAGINLKSKSLQQYIAKYKPKRAVRLSLEYKKETFGKREAVSQRRQVVFDFPVYLCGERKIWEET